MAAYLFDFTNNNFAFYLDDELLDEIDAPVIINEHTGGNALGAFRGDTKIHTGDISGNGMYFGGMLDDIRFYDRIITEEELVELYCSEEWCFEVVSGCMDPEALNYDPAANEEDGSCFYGVQGDIDQDSELDIVDIIIILSYILSGEEYTPEQFILADYNHDGSLDVLDVIMMVDCILTYCWEN